MIHVTKETFLPFLRLNEKQRLNYEELDQRNHLEGEIAKLYKKSLVNFIFGGFVCTYMLLFCHLDSPTPNDLLSMPIYKNELHLCTMTSVIFWVSSPWLRAWTI